MTTLLIDADLYVYSTACAFQIENPFNGEIDFDERLATRSLDAQINFLCSTFHTRKVRCFFSCPRDENWRRTLVPTYKSNRNKTKPPVGLNILKKHLESKWACIEEPTLEADDLLGIYSTDQSLCKGDSIRVSWDKDFLTIPTKVFNPRKNARKNISREDAFKFFIYQIIVGDTADGYKGFLRCGPKRARAFITKQDRLVDGFLEIWEPLLELAATCHGHHDEKYVIDQARMAHILVAGDYNFETKEIKLWEPSQIKTML